MMVILGMAPSAEPAQSRIGVASSQWRRASD